MRARSLARRGFSVAWLALVWMLLWGTFSWGNVVAGAVIGLLVVSLLALPDVRFRAQPNFKGLVIWFGTVFSELVVASFQVAWQALHPNVESKSAIIEVQLQSRSELVHALVIESLTLVPGGMVLEFRRTDRTLFSHVLGVHTEEEMEHARQHALKMERLIINAIGDRRGEI